MKNYVLLFLAFCSVNLFAQCDNPQMITQGTTTYYGCLTDAREMHGPGTLTHTSKDQIQIQDGIWEYGDFLSGKISWLTNKEDLIQVKEGEFNKQGVLKTGVTKSYNLKFQCGEDLFTAENSIEETIINNYEEEASTSNFKNHYNASDIISDNVSTTVKLRSTESHKFLKMMINDEEYEWMFDTGGGDISIGYNSWQRILKNDQGDILDLNIQTCANGVGGIAYYNSYKINNLKIGDFTLNNVVVSVAVDEGNNNSLIGVPFLKKFSDVQWSLITDELLLVK